MPHFIAVAHTASEAEDLIDDVQRVSKENPEYALANTAEISAREEGEGIWVVTISGRCSDETAKGISRQLRTERAAYLKAVASLGGPA